MKIIASALSFALAAGLAGCSSFSTLETANRERREFRVRKVWVRSSLGEKNEGYRKINRVSPVLAGNVLLTGNAIDGVVAFDRETGSQLWRLPTVNGVEGGAAVIRDRLFFGASDGQFYCVDVRNGHVLWSFTTGAETLGEPLLDATNGIVYVLTAANVVHALEADSGKPVWVFSRQDTNNFSVRGSTRPVLRGETLFVGFSDGYLSALNAKSGQVRWEVLLNRNKRFRDVDTTPLVDGDRLYVAGYDDKLYCLSAERGDILWRLERGGYAGVTMDGGRLYYPTSNGEVLALEKESGREVWSYKVPNGIASSVAFYKGLLVFGESGGPLRFLQAGSGKAVTSFEPGRGIFSTPLVEEKAGRVYFISNEANVYALEVGWVAPAAFPFLEAKEAL